MGQVLEQEARRPTSEVEGAGRTAGRLRRPVVIMVVVVALLVGTAGGWAAFTLLGRDAGTGIEEIQRARAEGMVDYHERLWQARIRPRELERLRHEAMVDYHERLWRAEQERQAGEGG
jgi:hypothetical protein